MILRGVLPLPLVGEGWEEHTRQAKQKKSLQNSPLSLGRGLGRGVACYTISFFQIPYF
jgi:hypothetical protein